MLNVHMHNSKHTIFFSVGWKCTAVSPGSESAVIIKSCLGHVTLETWEIYDVNSVFVPKLNRYGTMLIWEHTCIHRVNKH